MRSRMFKWSVAVTSTLISSLPIAVHAQIIYGLDNAHHFKSRQHGPYFVQVASFHSASFANQLKQRLSSITTYPVHVSVSGKYHIVRIGPMISIDDVHSLRRVEKTSDNVHRPLKQINTPPVDSAQLKPKLSLVEHESKSDHPRPHWFVGVNAGVMKTRTSKNNITVPNGSDYPSPMDIDQYSTNSHQPAMIDLRAGKLWSLNQTWLPAYSLALRYQHVFNKSIQGTVTEYTLPEFVNYNYRWGVGADTLSLYSKINLVNYARFMPYVDLGLGVSSTQSKAYHETALTNVTPRYSPNYAAKRKNQLTYNLGAGLDFNLTESLLISAGYEYQSFGKLSSGYGQGPNWQSEKIDFGKFNANMGLVGLTYLFDGTMGARHEPYK